MASSVADPSEQIKSEKDANNRRLFRISLEDIYLKLSSVADPSEQIKSEKDANNRKLFRLSLEDIYLKLFTSLKLIIVFILIIFIIFYGYHLIQWIHPDDSIVVQPLLTGNFNPGTDRIGEALADRLGFELLRIKAIDDQDTAKSNQNAIGTASANHSISSDKGVRYYSIERPSAFVGSYSIERPITFVGSYSIERPITFSRHSVDYSISQLGTIGAGGISISLGHMLMSLKELSGNCDNIITGSLQKYGHDLYMVVTLSGSHYSKGIRGMGSSTNSTERKFVSR